MTVTMESMAKDTLTEMAGFNFSSATLETYSYYFKKFIKKAEEIENGLYSEQVIGIVLDEVQQQFNLGKICGRSLRYYRKVATLFRAYKETKVFVWGRTPNKTRYVLKVETFQTALDAAIAEMTTTTHLAAATVGWYGNVIRKFCFFLESKGILSFSKLSINDVISFIESTQKTNQATMGLVIRHLKTFIGFLNQHGLCLVDVDIPILKPIKRREKNIVYFSKDEIKKLIDAFVFDAYGRRDYAILLLAIHTGLRRSDICNLKLQDISWRNYSITLRQKKTGKESVVPLVPSAGNAVADYILYERPKTLDDSIFLIHTNPIRPLKPSGADSIVRRRCKKAEIVKPEKCTIHSFRRSLCTWLSEQSFPVDEIAQCIGHANIHSADRYVVSSPSMQDCCLDFKGIAPKGWARR